MFNERNTPALNMGVNLDNFTNRNFGINYRLGIPLWANSRAKHNLDHTFTIKNMLPGSDLSIRVRQKTHYTFQINIFKYFIKMQVDQKLNRSLLILYRAKRNFSFGVFLRDSGENAYGLFPNLKLLFSFFDSKGKY